jgi:hypothetical protein
VELSLESVGDGTRLLLVESGFAALPEDAYDHRFEENSSGWTSELEDLSVYVSALSTVG